MLCALLKNNIVVEVKDLSGEELSLIEQSNEYQQLVDISNDNPSPCVGWIFNGSQIIPPVGITAKKSMILTKLALRQRMTIQELIAIYTAKASNPVISILLDNLSAASYIDLERPDTISGTMYLVSQGLLTLQRAQEILNTPASASELYKG